MTTIKGIVEHGDAVGRTLGFPTANISLAGGSLDDGVWVGRARWDGGDWKRAAVSIGRRRTFYSADGPRLLEAHLLDFSDDIYGVLMEVQLMKWIRPQIRFTTVEELADQIHRDVHDAREWEATKATEIGPLGRRRRVPPRPVDTSVPAWAMRKVTAALSEVDGPGRYGGNPRDLARRLGLSKSLVRRCLCLLEHR